MAISIRNPGRTVLSASRARQGRYGRHVLWVLLASTILAALALFAAWTWRAPDLTAADQRAKSHPSEPFNAAEPVAQQTPSHPGVAP